MPPIVKNDRLSYVIMDFDTDYTPQQVPSRTRDEKLLVRDRDQLEKARLAARHEHFERHQIIDNLVKPAEGSSMRIDDTERFNRDYTQDQRWTKQNEYDRIWGRAAGRRAQQVAYAEAIEERRRQEAAEAAKIAATMSEHDFNKESVLYNPVTNEVPDETTEKGQTQRGLDTRREFLRDARARRIQHCACSTQYDPITGEERTFW